MHAFQFKAALMGATFMVERGSGEKIGTYKTAP
jgi:hypothetical protein